MSTQHAIHWLLLTCVWVLSAPIFMPQANIMLGMASSARACYQRKELIACVCFLFWADAKSSQFASHSQPTLNAVWKHQPSRLRQLPGRPCPPAQRALPLRMEPAPLNSSEEGPGPAALGFAVAEEVSNLPASYMGDWNAVSKSCQDLEL